MPRRQLDSHNLHHDEDWEGNNAAFTCPNCGKVFIVSGSAVHHGERKCPKCGKSTGRCEIAGRKSGGAASLEWDDMEVAGMEEGTKRRFDAVSVIWSGLWKNFNERRKYEWRLAFGLWTVAAIFVANFVFRGPPHIEEEWIKYVGWGVAAGAVLLHLIFLVGLNEANRTDRCVMRTDEERMRSLSRATLPEDVKKQIARWAEKRKRSFLGDWTSLPTLGITLLFYLLVALLIGSIKVSSPLATSNGSALETTQALQVPAP